jgi:hypothetical protein
VDNEIKKRDTRARGKRMKKTHRDRGQVSLVFASPFYKIDYLLLRDTRKNKEDGEVRFDGAGSGLYVKSHHTQNV